MAGNLPKVLPTVDPTSTFSPSQASASTQYGYPSSESHSNPGGFSNYPPSRPPLGSASLSSLSIASPALATITGGPTEVLPLLSDTTLSSSATVSAPASTATGTSTSASASAVYASASNTVPFQQPQQQPHRQQQRRQLPPSPGQLQAQTHTVRRPLLAENPSGNGGEPSRSNNRQRAPGAVVQPSLPASSSSRSLGEGTGLVMHDNGFRDMGSVVSTLKPATSRAKAFYSNAIAGPSTLPPAPTSPPPTASTSTRHRSHTTTSAQLYNHVHHEAQSMSSQGVQYGQFTTGHGRHPSLQVGPTGSPVSVVGENVFQSDIQGQKHNYARPDSHSQLRDFAHQNTQQNVSQNPTGQSSSPIMPTYGAGEFGEKRIATSASAGLRPLPRPPPQPHPSSESSGSGSSSSIFSNAAASSSKTSYASTTPPSTTPTNSIHHPSPKPQTRVVVPSPIPPAMPTINPLRAEGSAALQASSNRRARASPGPPPSTPQAANLPYWASKPADLNPPSIPGQRQQSTASFGLASPPLSGGIGKDRLLPTPPSSANTISPASASSTSHPRGIPISMPSSPPPRPASRQAVQHQKRQEAKKKRREHQGGGYKSGGSDVEGPSMGGHRSHGHSRNGSVNAPAGAQGVGAKTMPMPLVLNSAILAPANAQSGPPKASGSGCGNINVPSSSHSNGPATGGSSLGGATRTAAARTPSRTRQTGNRRERSADSYLESDGAKTTGPPAVGYRVFKQGAEEVMERAGRTMGPRAAGPIARGPGRGRSSSAADLLTMGSGTALVEPAKQGGVEKGSLLDLKMQHSNQAAANVKSAPTSPRLGFGPIPITSPVSPPLRRARGDTVPALSTSLNNANLSTTGKRRPSVTLNTSTAVLSGTRSGQNSQQTSPIGRIAPRPLPIPNSNVSGTAPLTANAAKALRSLPSPVSNTSANPLNIFQIPTPSSTTSTTLRQLPPRTRSETTTPTLPYGTPSFTFPNRPYAVPSPKSGSPKFPLSLSIPNAPGKQHMVGSGSPRMLPTPLTTTKEKEKELDPPSVLPNEPSLMRNSAPKMSVVRPPLPSDQPMARSYIQPFGRPSQSEFSPISATSASDTGGESGPDALHSHPSHLAVWSEDAHARSAQRVVPLGDDEQIVFRPREEVDQDDGVEDSDHETDLAMQHGPVDGGLNKEYIWGAGWGPAVDDEISPSDRSKPLSPIVVGNSTFNDVDEARAADARQRFLQRQKLLNRHSLGLIEDLKNARVHGPHEAYVDDGKPCLVTL
ncbi:hypothetical protein FA15DRAFT_493960 [Coprinopsis marcescibilis]|uniref:Uncharacterized protein n=1 Tax=Coprinopsis marcescibilis TaxID=230819 RepID=A0A5C3KT76_COPMA|nr:hypothetical protein FA15DRAFT_493960 [Coprinopsis marcescibilis]